MRKSITILAVVVGLASAAYAYWMHSQPKLPYYEPHHVAENGCVAWGVQTAVVVLCEEGVAVMLPESKGLRL